MDKSDEPICTFCKAEHRTYHYVCQWCLHALQKQRDELLNCVKGFRSLHDGRGILDASKFEADLMKHSAELIAACEEEQT